MRRFILIGGTLLVLSVSLMLFIGRLSTISLTINYANVSSVSIYKTFDYEKLDRVPRPVTRLTKDGQTVNLAAGSYTLKYNGVGDYASGFMTIELSRKHHEVTIDPDYSALK